MALIHAMEIRVPRDYASNIIVHCKHLAASSAGNAPRLHAEALRANVLVTDNQANESLYKITHVQSSRLCSFLRSIVLPPNEALELTALSARQLSFGVRQQGEQWPD